MDSPTVSGNNTAVDWDERPTGGDSSWMLGGENCRDSCRRGEDRTWVGDDQRSVESMDRTAGGACRTAGQMPSALTEQPGERCGEGRRRQRQDAYSGRDLVPWHARGTAAILDLRVTPQWKEVRHEPSARRQPPRYLVLDSPHELARWRPLVNWVLYIPHAIILDALQILARAVFLVYWLMLIFTGRLHPGLYGVLVMYER